LKCLATLANIVLQYYISELAQLMFIVLSIC